MLLNMGNSIKKKVVGTIAALSMITGSILPIIPHDATWKFSYETYRFDTVDGDLDLNQYAINSQGEFVVRSQPKDVTQFYLSTSTDEIIGKTLVNIVGKNYYNVFTNNEKTYRLQGDAEQYNKMRVEKNTPQPYKKGFTSLAKMIITPEVAKAMITFDATSSASETAAVTSVSWSHTVGTVSGQPFLIAACGQKDTSSTDPVITGITYNSVAMTKARSDNNIAGGGARTTEIWGLANPTTGANTVAVTFTGTSDASQCIGISLYGVRQSNSADATAGTASTSCAPSGGAQTDTVTTVTPNDWVFDMLAISQTVTPSTPAGHTQNWLKVGTNLSSLSDRKMNIFPAGATAMKVTMSNVGCTHTVAAYAPYSVYTTMIIDKGATVYTASDNVYVK